MTKQSQNINHKNNLNASRDLTIEQITKAMLFHEGEPFASSTQIAKYFGIRHDNLLAKIRTSHYYTELVKSLKIKELKRTYRGREYPYFELDADAFTFISMGINGRKAESFKWVFIEAFKKATADAIRERVTSKTNNANQQWLKARKHGKDTRKLLQDKIKKFCKYAEEQRGKPYKVCPFYKLVTDAIYAYLGVEVPKAGKSTRDVYSGDMVEAIENAELEVIVLLDEVMSNNGSRKGIKDLITERLNTEKFNGVT